VVRAMARYSASMLDLETTCYFLADHEMRFGPKKIPNLVVERRSSGLLAQSKSQKPVSVRGPDIAG
jgi:hypothetical protein